MFPRPYNPSVSPGRTLRRQCEGLTNTFTPFPDVPHIARLTPRKPFAHFVNHSAEQQILIICAEPIGKWGTERTDFKAVLNLPKADVRTTRTDRSKQNLAPHWPLKREFCRHHNAIRAVVTLPKIVASSQRSLRRLSQNNTAIGTLRTDRDRPEPPSRIWCLVVTPKTDISPHNDSACAVDRHAP